MPSVDNTESTATTAHTPTPTSRTAGTATDFGRRGAANIRARPLTRTVRALTGNTAPLA
nr:hypothetical protein Aca09nite_60940 [Actinoplanes campanulatus]